jgi:nicotinamidase-related amidase
MDRFFLNREESILVIIDIQERLAAVMKEREKVISNTLHLVEAARLMGIPVMITEQYPKGLGPTVGEIRDGLSGFYSPLEKLAFSCCQDRSFMDSLRRMGRKKVILCGMEAHVCVLQTCLDLLREGYHVHTVRDAICSRAEDNFLTGIGIMRDAGAVITSTETVLFQLLGRAGTEEFRMISRRIK